MIETSQDAEVRFDGLKDVPWSTDRANGPKRSACAHGIRKESSTASHRLQRLSVRRELGRDIPQGVAMIGDFPKGESS